MSNIQNVSLLKQEGNNVIIRSASTGHELRHLLHEGYKSLKVARGARRTLEGLNVFLYGDAINLIFIRCHIQYMVSGINIVSCKFELCYISNNTIDGIITHVAQVLSCKFEHCTGLLNLFPEDNSGKLTDTVIFQGQLRLSVSGYTISHCTLHNAHIRNSDIQEYVHLVSTTVLGSTLYHTVLAQHVSVRNSTLRISGRTAGVYQPQLGMTAFAGDADVALSDRPGKLYQLVQDGFYAISNAGTTKRTASSIILLDKANGTGLQLIQAGCFLGTMKAFTNASAVANHSSVESASYQMAAKLHRHMFRKQVMKNRKPIFKE